MVGLGIKEAARLVSKELTELKRKKALLLIQYGMIEELIKELEDGDIITRANPSN